MFSALEDAQYAQRWKALQANIEALEQGGASPSEIQTAKDALRELEEARETKLNEEVRSLSGGDYKSVDGIFK